MNEEELKSLYGSIKNIEIRLKYIEQYVKKLWEVRENVINISIDQVSMRKEYTEEKNKVRKPKKPSGLYESDEL